MKDAAASRGRPASRRSRLRTALIFTVILLAYPVFVVGATYQQFFRAGLPGGRNGPADAYRHSLASAIVAYTLSPRCVALVTQLMERDGRGSASRSMDAHNNRAGARIGAASRSWSAMQTAVRDAVSRGRVDARAPDQITWLPPARWQHRLY